MTQSNRQRLGRNEARDVILEAAARVFNSKGKGLTVEDIAQEAGYSTSALYKHFSNKEDILRTLWKRVGERTLEVFQSEPPLDLPFIERLRWTLYRLAKLAEDERELFLAGFANTPVGEPINQIDEDLLEHASAMHCAVVTLMKRGIEEGTLQPRDPRDYAMALGGHLKAMTGHWAHFGPFPLKPHIETALEIFLYGAATSEAREGLSEQ